MSEEITFQTVHPEYGFNSETEEEYIDGASIDLETLYDEMGEIPHPRSICNNPPIQMEIWIALSKHNTDDDGKRVPLRGHERSIPGILNWIGSNIGFYDDDHEFANERGFVCTADWNNIELTKSRLFIYWKE